MEWRFYQVQTYYDNKIRIYSFYYNNIALYDRRDSGVFFPYDTSFKKYSPAGILLEIYNDKKENVIFTDWTLSFDSSQSLSFKLEEDSVPISSITIDSIRYKKNLLLAFTTSLAPSTDYRYFAGTVQCHAHFAGKDSLCIIPLSFIFDRMPKSGVPLPDNNANFIEVYPNPSTGTTHAFCKSKMNSLIHLKIFDELGKDMMTVYDGTLPEGKHDFSFKLPQGMYYVRMETAEGVVTKKVIVE
ncbi:MAG: T9SS type A sorting domain-containing protein [Candidatus Kapaibacterium sp.]